MARPYLPFIAFLGLLLLTLAFSFDFSTSVVPGWHTTIYPPHFILIFALILVLLFAAIAYWLVLKRVDKTSWTLFIIHFLLTISTVIFIRTSAISLNVYEANQEALFKSLSLRIKLIPLAYGLFILGQVLFLIYFIKTIRTTVIGRRAAASSISNK